MVLVSRKPLYAMVNFMLPNFFLVALGFLQFTIPIDEVADRIAVSLTLLLTAAAYRFAITTMVPAVSYLTMLDKYVLACSIFIIIMVIESGFVALLARKDEKAAEDVESATMIGLVVLVGVFHALFALQVMWKKNKGKDFKSHNLKNWKELARIRLEKEKVVEDDQEKKVENTRDTRRNRGASLTAVAPENAEP